MIRLFLSPSAESLPSSPAIRLPRPAMRRLRPIALLLAVLVASPTFAQRVSTADRLTALEQQLGAMTSGNLNLLREIDQLKAENQTLRAQVEELQQQTEQLKQQARTQYLDLDTRLGRVETTSTVTSTASTTTTASTTPASTNTPSTSTPSTITPSTITPSTPAARPAPPKPATPATPAPTVRDTLPRVYGDAATLGKGVAERDAYNAAFDTLKAGRYADASRMFQDFLDAHPDGAYAPNALYWLGESYYVTQNYALAQEQFEALLGRYPTHDKTPGALLKVGLSQYGLRQLDAAEVTLNQVVSRYPGTEAARAAADRLRAMELSRVK